MDYSEAKALMATARDPYLGKPLANNTRLFHRHDGFAVRLHSTDVVTILPNRRWRLSSGGWHSVTTRDRINRFGPGWSKIYSEKGTWYLPLRPTDKDPEPPYPNREILKPYVASDPGPEPVKSPEGCIAGQIITEDKSRQTFLFKSIGSDREKFERGDHAGLVEEDDRSWRVREDYTETTQYVETQHETYGWHNPKPEGVDKRVQCPHCAEFDGHHNRWEQAMNGGYWAANPGYRRYVENLERFGTIEAWRDAYKAEGREVFAARKLWRAWQDRNRIAFYDGVVVDSDGYPFRSHVEAIERARRKAQRASIKRAKEQAALERKRQRERDKARKAWNAEHGESVEDPSMVEFCVMYGIAPKDGYLTVYKSVGSDLVSKHGYAYPIGETIYAEDWDGRSTCGGGLHFGPNCAVADSYNYLPRDWERRYLECRVPISASVVVGIDKIKSASCIVDKEVFPERDEYGRPVF